MTNVALLLCYCLNLSYLNRNGNFVVLSATSSVFLNSLSIQDYTVECVIAYLGHTGLNKKSLFLLNFFWNVQFDSALQSHMLWCWLLMCNSVLVYFYQSVVVKGLERNISCLYEARRLLLGLDSCETAKVTDVTPDPVLAGSGLTSYWLNMLLQQLRLSEQGEHTHIYLDQHWCVSSQI